MKLCLSNLALPPVDHRHLLAELPPLGVKGLEVALGHTWGVAPEALTGAMVEDYRKAVEAEGMVVPALHLTLDDMAEFGPVEDEDLMEDLGDRLRHLGAMARDLGAPSLVLDAIRVSDLPRKEAWAKCRDFLEDLIGDFEEMGTTLCFTPVAEDKSAFCATSKDSYLMANALDEAGFGVHMSAAGLTEAGETGHTFFAMLLGRLEHFHVNDPGLAELGSTGEIDHVGMGLHLAAIDYERWVSVLQRAPSGENDPLASVSRGVEFVTKTYLSAEGHERL